MAGIAIRFTLNGQPAELEVQPHHTLLKCLRDDLGMTGTKEGCANGDCGACVVLMDGKPVNACLVFALEAEGHDIMTVEGLAQGSSLHPLQQSLLEHEAFQCGFCTPGVLMTAYGLMQENPHPTPEEVRAALAGNLCRCTGYERIISAVVATGERQDG